MIFPFSTTSFLGLFFLAAIMYPAIFETKESTRLLIHTMLFIITIRYMMCKTEYNQAILELN